MSIMKLISSITCTDASDLLTPDVPLLRRQVTEGQLPCEKIDEDCRNRWRGLTSVLYLIVLEGAAVHALLAYCHCGVVERLKQHVQFGFDTGAFLH